ncbi:MAG: hypothetical protein PHU03_04510 [Syntrophales bacterium]|nr:hypothetical protein [Syntrophales bacterium]
MVKKIPLIVIITAIVCLWMQSVEAKPVLFGTELDKKVHETQLKPSTLRPSLTVPPAKTVKEVGGVQYGRHIDIKLGDGTTVRCFPKATGDSAVTSNNYQYLPANPRVSIHPDGTPKFSMVRFVTDKSVEEGGTEGAILHFLVEYGLTEEQQKETQSLLGQKVKGAKLTGAVPLEGGAEGNSFHVISATLTDEGFTSTLVTSGKAPVMEGQAVAVAARLDQYGAQLLAKSLEQPTTDISVVFDLKYVVKLPSYDVRIVFDYEKYHELESEYTYARDKTTTRKRYWNPKWYNPFNISTRKATTITEEEQKQMMDFLTETGTITFEEIDHIPDRDQEIVDSALRKMVLESFFDMQSRLGQPLEEEIVGADSDETDQETIEGRRAEAAKVNHYRYTVFQRKEITRKSKYSITLSGITSRYEQHTMTGNVGAWYEKYKDNPKVVTEVNLDDPFFQRREMRFVIDNEAYDIFKEMVNYATIQIRVPRKGERPFIDERTIDRKYLEENGQTATLTYARMGDDAQTFEYATQWSLRGGYLYPSEPQWRKGDMMAVTLAAPVSPMVIEAEADLVELEEMGVARVSVELRYNRFGKSFVDQRGLSLSPGVGEPVVEHIIYHDADSEAVEYRLVYFHKKLGRIVDKKWQPVRGAYIYCAPTELLINKVRELLDS